MRRRREKPVRSDAAATTLARYLTITSSHTLGDHSEIVG